MEKIVKLKYPFQCDADGLIKEITELKLCRLKGKHIKKLPKEFFDGTNEKSPEKVIPIIAVMNQIPENQLDDIDIEDLITIAEELKSFL